MCFSIENLILSEASLYLKLQKHKADFCCPLTKLSKGKAAICHVNELPFPSWACFHCSVPRL